MVVAKKDAQGSPRLSNTRARTIAGILTARDINCFDFDDQLVSDFMTPLSRMIFYEVEDGFSSLNCNLNELLSECKKLLIKNKIEKIPIINPRK